MNCMRRSGIGYHCLKGHWSFGRSITNLIFFPFSTWTLRKLLQGALGDGDAPNIDRMGSR